MVTDDERKSVPPLIAKLEPRPGVRVAGYFPALHENQVAPEELNELPLGAGQWQKETTL